MSTASTLPEILVPPLNFAMVCPGVYRSGYPTKKNYPFLRALRLRSVLYLCPEDYAEGSLKFCEESGISVLRFPTEGNKEPFNDISEPLMHRILSTVCDVRNLPVLIHCNKGKHRTGTVVAALRHLQGWSLVSIFEEYKSFAGDKARVGDQQYIELYYPIVRLSPPYVPAWFQPTPRVKVVYSEQALLEEEMKQLGYSLLAPDLSTPGKMTFNTVTVGAITTTTNVLTTPSGTTATTAPTTSNVVGGVGQAGGVPNTAATPVTATTSANANNNNNNNNANAAAVSPTGGIALGTPITTTNTNTTAGGAFASPVSRTLTGFATATSSTNAATTNITTVNTSASNNNMPGRAGGQAKMPAMRSAPVRSPPSLSNPAGQAQTRTSYVPSATLPGVASYATNKAHDVPGENGVQESAVQGGAEVREGGQGGLVVEEQEEAAEEEGDGSRGGGGKTTCPSHRPGTAEQTAAAHDSTHNKPHNNSNNNNISDTAALVSSTAGAEHSTPTPPTMTTTTTASNAASREARREGRSARKTASLSSTGRANTSAGAGKHHTSHRSNNNNNNKNNNNSENAGGATHAATTASASAGDT